MSRGILMIAFGLTALMFGLDQLNLVTFASLIQGFHEMVEWMRDLFA